MLPIQEVNVDTSIELPAPVSESTVDEQQTKPDMTNGQKTYFVDPPSVDSSLPPSDDHASESSDGTSLVAQLNDEQADETTQRGEELDEFPLVGEPDTMRITKRSSGGRGEYEISETFAQLTPRDLLGRALVLDLGEGLAIPSGIRLLDRNGKRRLRIDASTGAEIHLHRQLAAALLMPYPARGETVWGSGQPVMESDRYGIGNVEMSHVELRPDEALIVPASLEIANADQNAAVDCGERLRQVRLLWNRHSELPVAIATLLAQHQEEISGKVPLGPRAEAVVADLQRATAIHARTYGMKSSETADAVPMLLELLEMQKQESAPSPEFTESPTAEVVVPPLTVQTPSIPPVEESLIPCESTPVEVVEPLSEATTTTPPDVTSVTLDLPESVPTPQPVPEAAEGIGDTAEDAPFPPEQLPPEEGVTQLPSTAKPSATPQPRRYQPQARTAAPKKRNASTAAKRQEPSERSCPIEVRLRNRVGGAFTLSLLPRRREGMPEEIEVSGAGDSPLTLNALHESWYQDIVPADTASVLEKGITLYTCSSASRLQWTLSGRDLYVLGPRDELSGYVSTPRLTLGEQHVVICTEHLREQAFELLKQCCESVPTSIDPEDGLPLGWAGFRCVSPLRPLPPSASPEILDALRPAPDLQIRLRGGIRLLYSQWLIGFPPAIQVVGADAHEQLAVTIDGRTATAGPDLAFTVDGWDKPGEHVVACGGVTRSYCLVSPPDEWDSWPAHGRDGTLAVCGGMVGSTSCLRKDACVVVPATNPLLLGSHPGEIYLCRTSAALRLGFCSGSPPFKPVWAVPASPLNADKSVTRILFLEWPAQRQESETTSYSGIAVRRWSQAILDCSRKGLRLANESPQTLAVWRAYCQQAKAIWRGRR